MRLSLIQVLQVVALVFWTLAGLQAATQTAARLLAYDPQLGAPLFEMVGTPVYPPWRFVVWRFAFGEHAPTTFAASYPAILLGIAAGASNAVLLLLVPDAAAYRDPFALAARPSPIMPFLPSPTARLARLIADAEAEVMTAKDDAMKRAVRIGEAEAAKRLAKAERRRRQASEAGIANPRAPERAERAENDAARSPADPQRSKRAKTVAPDPAQPLLPFGSPPAGAAPTGTAGPSSTEVSAAPVVPPTTDRRHRMDFL